jgi:hypothetical protein
MGVSSAFVHVTAWRSMRDADHVTLNLKNSMSTAEAYLDVGKAFETTWHPGLLYEVYKLHFSSSSFLSNRKFRVTAEGELSSLRYTSGGTPRFHIGPYSVQTIYKRYSLNPRGPPSPFADDTTDRKEGYILRKLRWGLTSFEAWCERWNIKTNEDKAQAIYFSHRRRPVEAFRTMKGRNIPL